MYTLESDLLKRKFSKTANTDFPDQEVYPDLPADLEGEAQPVAFGVFAVTGSTIPEIFLSATPTVITALGTDNEDGTWIRRKFKIHQVIKNPETGFVHSPGTGMIVLRYQNEIVTVLTEGTNYTLANNRTEIEMLGGTAGRLQNEAQLRIYNAWAQMDDAAGTFTGVANNPIVFVPDIIHMILVCIGGIPSAKIDINSLTRVGFNKPGQSGGTFKYPTWMSQTGVTANVRAYFDSQRTIRAFLDELAFQAGHRLVVNEQGKFALRRLETQPKNITTSRSGLVSEGTAYVTDADIHQYKETLRLDTIVNRINVKYFQVPAGSQMDFKVFVQHKRKRRRETVPSEMDSFFIANPTLTKTIGGISFRDDFLEVIGQEAKEIEIITYWVNLSQAQDLANYLYLQWGEGYWSVSLTDISGNISNIIAGDLVLIHRSSSVFGDISYGKVFRLVDATARVANNVVVVSRLDEVKI